MDYLQPYLDFFTTHPFWALAVVFLIAFGEALLIVGLFVPSTTILVGAGMLVGTGHLGFWPVMAATALGAILGDQVSYWAGRLYGPRLKRMWPLNLYPALVEKSELFVRDHGGKSIAIGRFVPGVKAVVPGIVGMVGMREGAFLAVNVASGIVWAALHVLPGVLIGKGLAMAGDVSGRLMVVLLVLIAVLALLGWLIRLAAAGLSPHVDDVLRWLSRRARGAGFRPLHRLGRALDPANPRSTLILIFMLLALAAVVALIDLLSGLMLRQAVSNIDLSARTLLLQLRNAPADALMLKLSMLGDAGVSYALAAVTAFWLVWRRNWRAAAAVLLTMLSASLVVAVLHSLVARPAPGLAAAVLHNSFPAATAVFAAVAFGILASVAGHAFGVWSRAAVIAACSLPVLAIGFSEVYLGTAWLSDVLGGLLIGVLLVSAFGMVIEALPPRRILPLGLLAASTAAFVLVGGLHISHGYGRTERAFAAMDRSPAMTTADWLAGGYDRLPLRRIDLAGRPEERFFAQWAGNLAPLSATALAENWLMESRWRWPSGLAYLNPHASLADLPPRPLLHEGLPAPMIFIIPASADPPHRLVLRAYRSGQSLAGGETIHLLSLTRETLQKRPNLYALPVVTPATAPDEQAVLDALAGAPAVKRLAAPLREGVALPLFLVTP